MERRKTRPAMVQAQLSELDDAREKIKKDIAEKVISPRDLVYAIDALIKLQDAERNLVDEVPSDDVDEADIADLMA